MSSSYHRPLSRRVARATALLLAAALPGGCLSPTDHRENLDQAAYRNLRQAQQEALGRQDPDFRIESPADSLRRRLLLDQALPRADAASLGAANVPRIPQWPDRTYRSEQPGNPQSPTLPPTPLRPSLLEALQIAARHSREYQTEKEAVFLAAMRLDFEQEAFRNTWTGRLSGLLSTDGAGEEQVSGATGAAGLGLQRALTTGGSFAFDLGVDLAKLLTQDRASSLGLLADATLTLPLLRGSGRFVVTEPLTQAQRDTVYAIHRFERFKATFAVRVATAYLGVLQQLDQADTARDSLARLRIATDRARRLADAGRLPAIQVDQALQDELRASNRAISARLDYERRLDDLKVLLGLPPDAHIEVRRAELEHLATQAAGALAAATQTNSPPTAAATRGPWELNPDHAVRQALSQRLDLRTTIGRVFDAQRAVAVAADQLRADLNLLGRAATGQARGLGAAGQPNATLAPDEGRYSLGLQLEPPLNRTSERHAYRRQLLAFENAVREVQALEDQIKIDVRDALRALEEGRETVRIQAAALEVARRRRDSAGLFLEAGRAQMRDVLEAEESLVSARNAAAAALVGYRTAEFRLQRDIGSLESGEDGLLRAFPPDPDANTAPAPSTGTDTETRTP